MTLSPVQVTVFVNGIPGESTSNPSLPIYIDELNPNKILISRDFNSISSVVARSDEENSNETKLITTTSFEFEKVVTSSTSSTEELHAVSTKPLLDMIISGHDASIVAYGTNNSGKTTLLWGSGDAERGIASHFVADLFLCLRNLQSNSVNKQLPKKSTLVRHHTNFSVKLSLFHIMYEEIFDMLHPHCHSYGHDVDLRTEFWQMKQTSKDFFPFITNLTIMDITSAEEFESIFSFGRQNQSICLSKFGSAELQRGKTQTILSLTVTQSQLIFHSNYEDTETQLTSQIYLVEIQGTERNCKAVTIGFKLKQACRAGLAYGALGNVICSLTGSSNRNVLPPYRDSKITRLLQNALGGSSYLRVLGCLSSTDPAEFSLSTLRYLHRMQQIQNIPLPHAKTISDYHMSDVLQNNIAIDNSFRTEARDDED